MIVIVSPTAKLTFFFVFLKFLNLFVLCVSGLVGSAYHIVAFQPDSAVAALQRATNSTVTMGKFIVIQNSTRTSVYVVYVKSICMSENSTP